MFLLPVLLVFILTSNEQHKTKFDDLEVLTGGSRSNPAQGLRGSWT